MRQDSPIIDFFSDPQNLSLAFEISEELETLKLEMHRQFWPAFARALEERLAESNEFSQSWEIWAPRDPNTYFKGWTSCTLLPVEIPDSGKRPYAGLIFQQSTLGRKFSFKYGISYTSVPTANSNQSRQLDSLKEKLLSKGFLTDKEDWYIGVNNSLSYGARKQNFIIKMLNERDDFMEELVDYIWNLLISCHDEITSYNQFIKAHPTIN